MGSRFRARARGSRVLAPHRATESTARSVPLVGYVYLFAALVGLGLAAPSLAAAQSAAGERALLGKSDRASVVTPAGEPREVAVRRSRAITGDGALLGNPGRHRVELWREATNGSEASAVRNSADGERALLGRRKPAMPGTTAPQSR